MIVDNEEALYKRQIRSYVILELISVMAVAVSIFSRFFKMHIGTVELPNEHQNDRRGRLRQCRRPRF